MKIPIKIENLVEERNRINVTISTNTQLAILENQIKNETDNFIIVANFFSLISESPKVKNQLSNILFLIVSHLWLKKKYSNPLSQNANLNLVVQIINT